MELSFANHRLRDLCECERKLRAQLGDPAAQGLVAHLASLRDSSTLEDLRYLPGRLRELGRPPGALAITIPGGKHLVFEAANSAPDCPLDWKTVRAIRLLHIA